TTSTRSRGKGWGCGTPCAPRSRSESRSGCPRVPAAASPRPISPPRSGAALARRSRPAPCFNGTCSPMPRKRRVCFVTGTRAEFGLMESTLAAIRNHPKLELQIVVTGMHLDRRHGRSVDAIHHKADAKVPWNCGKGTPVQIARSTGRAISLLAETFDRLGTDIVLIVGDRVEAFAA